MSSGANRVPTLLYHDVVAEDRAGDASGFPGGAAGLYKLTVSAFEQHLEALRSLGVGAPALATGRGGAFMLHFDDGGTSALELIAPRLEAVGWRGHFFVPTRYLGTPKVCGSCIAAATSSARIRGPIPSGWPISRTGRSSRNGGGAARIWRTSSVCP